MFTKKQIDEMPKLDYTEGVMVMVRPYYRGQALYYTDSQGEHWTVGEYEPGNYYKEPYLGW